MEGTDYRVIVRFATSPDDAQTIAAEIGPLLSDHELSIVADDDIEVILHVRAPGAFAAGRLAMDRVQSALSESSFDAPELLNVDVEYVSLGTQEDESGPTEFDTEAVARAMAALPERERLVITFLYYEERPPEVVAQVLGLSKADIEAIHRNAIARLQGQLE